MGIISKKNILFTLTLISMVHFTRSEQPKIIGLMQVRNEENIIEPCLRAMALYTDAIIVLDDASEDHTTNIIQMLSEHLPIELLRNEKCEWQSSSERTNRQKLLQAGREAGGTHFVLLDADEMFVATCLKNDCLRKKILKMQPGQVMNFPMINVWDGVKWYRNDEECSPTHKKWSAIPAVFCDDKLSSYEVSHSWAPSGTLHVSRVPSKRYCTAATSSLSLHDLDYGILHYKFVNLSNIEIKKVWYMCLEYINANKNCTSNSEINMNAKKINNFYLWEFKSALMDKAKIKLSPLKKEWLEYSFFKRFDLKKTHLSRKKEVIAWLKKYGAWYFKPLNIWHLPWLSGLLAAASRFKASLT